MSQIINLEGLKFPVTVVAKGRRWNGYYTNGLEIYNSPESLCDYVINGYYKSEITVNDDGSYIIDSYHHDGRDEFNIRELPKMSKWEVMNVALSIYRDEKELEDDLETKLQNATKELLIEVLADRCGN